MACEHRLVGDDGKWRERESYPCPLCGADARLAQIEFTQTTASFVVLCPASPLPEPMVATKDAPLPEPIVATKEDE